MSLSNCKIVKDNCPHEEYPKQPDGVKRGNPLYVMSRSELVEFFLNPKRWLDGFGLDEDDSTPSTDWGTLIDCLVTGKDKFDSQFAVAPSMYPGAKGEEKPWTRQANYCKEWEADREAEGRQVVKADIMEQAELAVKAIHSDDVISELLSVSRKQVYLTGIWNDKTTGLEIPLRVLIDLVPPKEHPHFGRWLSDFKTARNGNPSQWARVVEDCNYDIQAALYFDIYCAATKEDRTDWVFALQENVAPYHVVKPLPALSQEFMAWGRLKYQKALSAYALCLSQNIWPSYAPAGLALGDIQLIAPDELWTYKKTAVQGRIER